MAPQRGKARGHMHESEKAKDAGETMNIAAWELLRLLVPSAVEPSWRLAGRPFFHVTIRK